LANLCYAKGYYSSLPEGSAIAQFINEFRIIRIGYQWSGYAYSQVKELLYKEELVYRELLKEPEFKQYQQVASDGSIYYQISDDSYYKWALFPDDKNMRKQTLARLMVHFKQGLADRP